MPFTATKHELDGVIIIKTQRFHDERGFFTELFKSSELKKLGIAEDFTQQNLSYSKKGVVRGLHYQEQPHAQGKLVTVLKGMVRDVFVDMRQGSATFGKSGFIDICDQDDTLIYIPEGFAHGFSVLSDDAIFLYLCTNEYNKASERGINHSDPSLSIDWSVENPITSEKDDTLPFLPR